MDSLINKYAVTENHLARIIKDDHLLYMAIYDDNINEFTYADEVEGCFGGENEKHIMINDFKVYYNGNYKDEDIIKLAEYYECNAPIYTYFACNNYCVDAYNHDMNRTSTLTIYNDNETFDKATLIFNKRRAHIDFELNEPNDDIYISLISYLYMHKLYTVTYYERVDPINAYVDALYAHTHNESKKLIDQPIYNKNTLHIITSNKKAITAFNAAQKKCTAIANILSHDPTKLNTIIAADEPTDLRDIISAILGLGIKKSLYLKYKGTVGDYCVIFVLDNKIAKLYVGTGIKREEVDIIIGDYIVKFYLDIEDKKYYDVHDMLYEIVIQVFGLKICLSTSL